MLVQVALHPVFTRVENDLLMTLPVSFAELVLGAEIPVPTFFGGEVKIRIPAGTKSNTILRVRGHGVKRIDIAGDLLVKVEVAVPQKINAKAKQAIEEFILNTSDEFPRKGLKEKVAL